MNSNSASSASNGSEKKPNHSTYNSFPLRTFHHQFLGRNRLAGLNAARQSLAEHAHGAEFHCSGEFIAAARAGALGVRAHSTNANLDSETTQAEASLLELPAKLNLAQKTDEINLRMSCC